MTGDAEHLPTRQHELDGPLHLSRSERRDGNVGPRAQAGAEPTADIRADDEHVVGGHAEDGRDSGRLVDEELALAPECQPSVVPRGDRRVRLHWIVIFASDTIRLIDSL